MEDDGYGAREHEPFQKVPRGADQHIAAAVDGRGVAKKLHCGHQDPFAVKREAVPPYRINSTAPQIVMPRESGASSNHRPWNFQLSQAVTGSSAFADDDTGGLIEPPPSPSPHAERSREGATWANHAVAS